MGKRDLGCRVEAVVHLLKKQSPLTLKQEKFCNTACVERFLKAKGDSVKKAAKQLRACLSLRDSIGTEHLIADEFSAELAEGVAYVAGHDHESRPVMILRMKHKFQSHKQFVRLLVFTLEVATSTMPKGAHQFVLLFDASFFGSASAFMNVLMATLKIVGEYYPGMLHKAFVIDPPSLFSYMWKGVKAFVELSAVTHVVSSVDLEEALDLNGFASHPRASSLRFDTSSTAKAGSSSSSRFSFTVSHNFDSLKPWYLSMTDTSSCGPTTPCSLGHARISPLNARSFSFASPAARKPPGSIDGLNDIRTHRKTLFPSTPLPARRAHRPSFLQSPATFFRREGHVTRNDRTRESFLPFLRLYRRPYDEMIYRSKMRPPLGGLISIVSPQLRRRHVSLSQRF